MCYTPFALHCIGLKEGIFTLVPTCLDYIFLEYRSVRYFHKRSAHCGRINELICSNTLEILLRSTRVLPLDAYCSHQIQSPYHSCGAVHNSGWVNSNLCFLNTNPSPGPARNTNISRQCQRTYGLAPRTTLTARTFRNILPKLSPRTSLDISRSGDFRNWPTFPQTRGALGRGGPSVRALFSFPVFLAPTISCCLSKLTTSIIDKIRLTRLVTWEIDEP